MLAQDELSSAILFNGLSGHLSGTSAGCSVSCRRDGNVNILVWDELRHECGVFSLRAESLCWCFEQGAARTEIAIQHRVGGGVCETGEDRWVRILGRGLRCIYPIVVCCTRVTQLGRVVSQDISGRPVQ